jgi:hypothetical protein
MATINSRPESPAHPPSPVPPSPIPTDDSGLKYELFELGGSVIIKREPMLHTEQKDPDRPNE